MEDGWLAGAERKVSEDEPAAVAGAAEEEGEGSEPSCVSRLRLRCARAARRDDDDDDAAGADDSPDPFGAAVASKRLRVSILVARCGEVRMIEC